jgi:two-component system nitrogen regulation sensor histidine kinase NtrY
LLATVPTGVLSVDASGTGFRPNPAAAKLLGHPEWAHAWQPMSELDRPGLEELYRRLESGQPENLQCELDLQAGGEGVHVDMTSRPLPGGGRVVAIDDLTQLMLAQRQAAWSEVAQRIAHEIRNPLTPIRLAAERIQKRASTLDDEMRTIVTAGCEAIVAQVTGLKELVDSFQEYARMPSIAPQPTNLGRLVQELRSLYDGVRHGLHVEARLPDDPIIAMVDPVLLRQALVNLLDNAAAAVSGKGRVSVSARTSEDDVILEVEDTGVGLPTEDTEMLLEPFFSTKGRGSGMGLALVHRVVSDHGGTLELESVKPTGARVRITLFGARITETV